MTKRQAITSRLSKSTCRYGFEATRPQVECEWLYRTRDRERFAFGHEGQKFAIAGALRREAPKHVQEQVRLNALFLSVLAQFNSPLASILVTWFKDVVPSIHGLEANYVRAFSVEADVKIKGAGRGPQGVLNETKAHARNAQSNGSLF